MRCVRGELFCIFGVVGGKTIVSSPTRRYAAAFGQTTTLAKMASQQSQIELRRTITTSGAPFADGALDRVSGRLSLIGTEAAGEAKSQEGLRVRPASSRPALQRYQCRRSSEGASATPYRAFYARELQIGGKQFVSLVGRP